MKYRAYIGAGNPMDVEIDYSDRMLSSHEIRSIKRLKSHQLNENQKESSQESMREKHERGEITEDINS